LYLVASQNPDAVLAHLACRMRDDLMAVFQLDPKRRVWQKFFHDTWEFEQFFLGHVISYICYLLVADGAYMRLNVKFFKG